MGIKRLLTVALVIALVLGLVVLLLFQAGGDQKLVKSLLPRVEERFGIDIRFREIVPSSPTSNGGSRSSTVWILPS